MMERACSIIICGNNLLFVEQIVNGQLRHVFIGGGIETNETPCNAALRELQEEADIKGKIVFGPVIVETPKKEHVFIVDILEDAIPILGHDPELPQDKQVIKKLVWLNAVTDIDRFNKFDLTYFSAVINEGRKMNTNANWITVLESIIKQRL